MSQIEQQGGRFSVEYHVPKELEYVYRDLFNVFAGAGDVVIEFGNILRSNPAHATIGNRIVVSFGNAHLLVKTLQAALNEAQANMQKALLEKK